MLPGVRLSRPGAGPAAFTDGHQVCFAVHSEATDTWLVYNLPQCELPLSPCSTFKIPNALLGLQDYALPEGFSGTLYGKTGSCPMPAEDHGWFVGWLEREDDRLVFAVNIIGEKLAGPDARRIAVRMLQNLQ